MFCCDVERYEADKRWATAVSPGTPQSRPLDLPETTGQRVEVIAGDFARFRGYIQDWDEGKVVINVYWKPSRAQPVNLTQLMNPSASLGRITVLPNLIQRLFMEGDVVLVKDLPGARFKVIYGISNHLHLNTPLHPPPKNFIPLVRMSRNTDTGEWKAPSQSIPSLVKRDRVVMGDTVHDPSLSSRLIRHTFRPNDTVKIIKGPYKGYWGRVRKIWGPQIHVELQANSKVEVFSPTQLAHTS